MTAAEARDSLSTQTKLGDDGAIALNIDRGQIIEQPTSAADQHEKAPATVVVLLVGFEMLSQMVDAIAEQGNLHFRRTGVVVASTVLGDRVTLGWQIVRFAVVTHGLVVLSEGFGPSLADPRSSTAKFKDEFDDGKRLA